LTSGRVNGADNGSTPAGRGAGTLGRDTGDAGCVGDFGSVTALCCNSASFSGLFANGLRGNVSPALGGDAFVTGAGVAGAGVAAAVGVAPEAEGGIAGTGVVAGFTAGTEAGTGADAVTGVGAIAGFTPGAEAGAGADAVAGVGAGAEAVTGAGVADWDMGAAVGAGVDTAPVTGAGLGTGVAGADTTAGVDADAGKDVAADAGKPGAVPGAGSAAGGAGVVAGGAGRATALAVIPPKSKSGGLINTTRGARSGNWRAKVILTAAPSACPTMAALPIPSFSIKSIRSFT